MTPLANAEGHWVSASHVQQLVEISRRWNVTPSQLFAGLEWDEGIMTNPGIRVPVAAYAALIERSRQLTGEPGLGFYLGLQKRMTGYGYLGFAAMSSSCLRDALELVARYASVVTSFVQVRLQTEGRMACLVIEEHVDLGSARDIPLIGLVSGMRRLASLLTGRDLRAEYVDLSIPEPPYFSRFQHLLTNARFGRLATQLVLDAKLLDLPLVHSDRAALLLTRDHCERALQQQGSPDVERVREVIWSDGGYRGLEDVAKTLALSSRTLKRRLAAQGVSFSALLAQERRRKATFLLDMRQMPLEMVAQRLGYSTVSNFARAFRHWTGKTPAEYRRSRGHMDPMASLGSLDHGNGH